MVLQFDTAANLTAVKLKPGTPAAAPEPPAILQNHNQYELGLCTVSVPAGSSVVTAADITDTRADEDVCGVMRDSVTGIPTAQLVEQWQAAQAAQMAQGTEKLDRLEQSIRNLDNGSFYTKAEADAKLDGYYTKTQVDSLLGSVNPFPVGSIYQSTDATSPAELYGGTWEQIASERVLMGASSAHKAGTAVSAGLPDISGSFTCREDISSGAFRKTSKSSEYSTTCSGSAGNYTVYTHDFYASRSSGIYGRSTTVQPAAYYVYIWHRVA